MGQKFSSITAAGSAPTSTDSVVGLASGADVRFSPAQIALSVLGSLFSIASTGLTWIGTQVQRTPLARLLQLDVTLSTGGNEATALVRTIIEPTGATSAYNKTGLQVNTTTFDPSTYPNTTLDCVSVGAAAAISASTTGRAWALTVESFIDPSCDGFLNGVEVGISNYGTDQATPDTLTSKHGITIIPRIGNTTLGLWFKVGAGQFHEGVYCDATAIVSGGHFLNFVGLFSVDSNGVVATQGVSTPIVAVSALPSAATNAGLRLAVNNATVTTYNSVVAGGGGNTVPVFSDGTNWRIG